MILGGLGFWLSAIISSASLVSNSQKTGQRSLQANLITLTMSTGTPRSS